MINNRQNGRRRGRGGPQVRGAAGGGGGGDRGNRIDNRARGNAAQLHEKYRNLARDTQTQGDRVMTEYYLQFADHYFRVLSESRQRFEEQNQPRRQREDADFDDGDQDGEDGYEGERMSRADQQGFRGDGNDQPYRNDARDQREPEPRYEQPQRQQQPVDEVREAAGTEEGGERRRGRRLRRESPSGDVAPERIEIDRLPPAFGAEPAANGAEPSEPAEVAEPAPRRRRRTKSDDSPVAA